jgi:membrane protease YdiL (CAAX protease family)
MTATAIAVDSAAHPPRSRGWDLVALGLIVPAPIIGVLASMVLWPGSVGAGVFIAAKVWMLVLPAFWMLVVDRQRWTMSRATAGGFRVGIALGLLISAVIGLAYLLVGTRFIDAPHVASLARETGIGTPWAYIGAAAYWICFNSVLEEFVYRWFIFRKCERFMPGWAAVLASALAFTLHHIIALGLQFDVTVTILGSVGVFIGGALWSWMYLKYRSVWPGYVSHAIVDVAVFGIGAWIIFGAV